MCKPGAPPLWPPWDSIPCTSALDSSVSSPPPTRRYQAPAPTLRFPDPRSTKKPPDKKVKLPLSPPSFTRAFNPSHVDAFREDGYTKEEMKMRNEAVKFLTSQTRGFLHLRSVTSTGPIPSASTQNSNPRSMFRTLKLLGKFEGLELFDA